jgi:hypothetical protein
MSILQKILHTVYNLQRAYITPAKARRFHLGVMGLSLHEFTSLNAIGRQTSENRWTGENRIRRLVADEGLANRLQKLLLEEALPSGNLVYCSLDHSQFGPFCIAVLAVSCRKGRAIPIWCQVNISEAGLIKPLLAALSELSDALTSDQQLVLVMDRWFCGPKLFKLISVAGWYLICRAKYDRRVIVPWEHKSIPVGEISHWELNIEYRAMSLRMVRSNLRSGMKEPEPWFLLTNLPNKISRRKIINRYAQRFEIEEAFKDIKWLNRLEWQRIRKPAVMRLLLLFVFLGWWLLWWQVIKQSPGSRVHPKKRLSWFRQAWERLQFYQMEMVFRPPM